MVEAFLRHKKKAIAFVAATLAVAVLIVLYAPRRYRSEAALFLQVGRESVRLDPTATTGQTLALQQSGRDNEIATAIEVLKSRAIVEQAVDRLTPEVVLGEGDAAREESNQVVDAILAPLQAVVQAIKSIDPVSKREEAITEVMDNYWVNAEFDSTMIVLSYDGETPQLSQNVVQAIVDVYDDEHVRLHRTVGSKPFFQQQRASLEQQLEDAETKLRDVKNEVGIVSVEARRATLEERLSQIELSRNATSQQVAAAEARTEALRQRIDEMPERIHKATRVVPNTGADALRTELYELEVKLLELEAKYQPEHPLVASARAQLAEAKQAISGEAPLREETEDGLNENHRSLMLDLSRAESELAALEGQKSKLDAQREVAVTDLKELNDVELNIDKLEREVQLANTNYFRYAEAFEQARMDEALDNQRITNVNVVQTATLVEKPVRPSKLLIGAGALFLAVAGSTALVLFCERIDSRLRSEEQVEDALQLPVLAAVPEGRAFRSLPASVR